MPTGTQAWTIYGIVGVIWLALLVLAGAAGQFAQVSQVTSIVPAMLAGAALFERYGWRWSRLHPWPIRMPVIRGTWRGLLTSLWVDPKTGERPAPKTAYLTVAQTLTTVSVRLHTDESASEQLAGIVEIRKGTGERIVIWTYMNTPRMDLREGSRPHYGGALLTIFGEPPGRLEGEYWTDRASKGALVMRGYSPLIADSFEQAQSLDFSESGQG
jgi:hypothetical protein